MWLRGLLAPRCPTGWASPPWAVWDWETGRSPWLCPSSSQASLPTSAFRASMFPALRQIRALCGRCRPGIRPPMLEKDRFQAAVLEQIVCQSTTAIAQGRRQFAIDLTPATLGTVDVSIAHEADAVVLKIAARLQSTQALIESDLDRLRGAFEVLLTQLAGEGGEAPDQPSPVG